jgi:acetolactate synthase I/III small subunit
MKHMLSVLVKNHAGMLSKVSELFSRRAFNIYSLAVGVTNNPSVSCMTIVVDGNDSIIEQVEKQLNKLIDVIKVKVLEPDKRISLELLLLKVHADANNRSEIVQIAQIFGAKIVDMSHTTLTLEYTDINEQIMNLTAILTPYGICETVRTGIIAIEKDSVGFLSSANDF